MAYQSTSRVDGKCVPGPLSRRLSPDMTLGSSFPPHPVHGRELDPSRRQMQDAADLKDAGAVQREWNRTLAEEVLATAYANVLRALRDMIPPYEGVGPPNTPDKLGFKVSPTQYFNLWPQKTINSALFQRLVEPLYLKLKDVEILPEFNETRLTWVRPTAAVFDAQRTVRVGPGDNFRRTALCVLGKHLLATRKSRPAYKSEATRREFIFRCWRLLSFSVTTSVSKRTDFLVARRFKDALGTSGSLAYAPMRIHEVYKQCKVNVALLNPEYLCSVYKNIRGSLKDKRLSEGWAPCLRDLDSVVALLDYCTRSLKPNARTNEAIGGHEKVLEMLRLAPFCVDIQEKLSCFGEGDVMVCDSTRSYLRNGKVLPVEYAAVLLGDLPGTVLHPSLATGTAISRLVVYEAERVKKNKAYKLQIGIVPFNLASLAERLPKKFPQFGPKAATASVGEGPWSREMQVWLKPFWAFVACANGSQGPDNGDFSLFNDWHFIPALGTCS